ncbi:hypothetical protein SLEP1_g783 [Rubroshorea leprosula]|uniref:GAG-pre-integrase domain-containing protein n=1 Tax=Rubroshorea leprosula TaxID=152421 RepID=A0AAV5HKP3_9ROSI|nr:hypothetical protein SLEP1_g783 [Rubroshorea leprosula]
MAFENYVQPSIPHFDGHHYNHWSMLMENFLWSKEYWTVLEAGIPDPASGANDAQMAKIEKEMLKDLKAKNYLFQAIDWAILETILNKSTSKTIWDSMKKKYRGNERAKRGESSNFAEHSEKNDDASLFMVYHPKEVSKKNVWYLDIGCNNHMCGDKSAFLDLDESFQDKVKFGDNSTIAVKGRGKGKITIRAKDNSVQTIANVLYVPNLKSNLLSLGQLQKKGYEILIKDGVCQVRDSKLGLIAKVKMIGNRLFPLYLQTIDLSCLSTKLKNTAWLWHCQYGHLYFGGLKALQQNKMVNGLPHFDSPLEIYEIYVVSKQHHDSFPKDRSWRAKRVLDLVYSDLCGSINPTSNGDQKRSKLDDKREKFIFLGVSDKSKAYRLYNPITKKVIISHDVVFNEASTTSWTQKPRRQIPTNFKNGEDLIVQNSGGQMQQNEGLTSADFEASRKAEEESLPTTEHSTERSLSTTPELEFETSSRPQRKKRRLTWLEDYEVTNLPQDGVLVTHFALFADCDPLIYEEAVKREK